MFILVKLVFNHLIWKNSWIYSVINIDGIYSTWYLFVWLILCCQVCEEKKCENPSKQISLLAFVIWYFNINVCI